MPSSPIVDARFGGHARSFLGFALRQVGGFDRDYLNCPLDRDQYERFVDALLEAQPVAAHIAEDRTPFFEACLPIEELARRGRETLRFGP